MEARQRTIIIGFVVFVIILFLVSILLFTRANRTDQPISETFVIIGDNASNSFFKCIQVDELTPCTDWKELASPVSSTVSSITDFDFCNKILYTVDSGRLFYLEGSTFIQSQVHNIASIDCSENILNIIGTDNNLYTCDSSPCSILNGFDPGNKPSSVVQFTQAVFNDVKVYFIIINNSPSVSPSSVSPPSFSLYYFGTGETDGWKLSDFSVPSNFIMRVLGDSLFIVDSNYPQVGYFSLYPPTEDNFIQIITANDSINLKGKTIQSISILGDLIYIITEPNDLWYKDITNIASDFTFVEPIPIVEFYR